MRDLILTGFMGTGKTTAAKRIAEAYGLHFVDTDDEVERRAGRTITQIFQQEGEEAFRAVEAGVLSDVLPAGCGRVIAVGGGALLRPEARALLSDDQVVICLTCEPREAMARAGGGDRPLLEEGDLAAVEALLESRRPVYDLYPQVNTGGAADVTSAIAALAHASETATIDLQQERRSLLLFGRGLLARLPDLMSEHGLDGGVIVVSDETVRALPFAARALWELAQTRTVYEVTIPPGEESKRLETLETLYRVCLEHRLDRSAIVLGLGGGVVGDIAGMVAATYLRGVRLVLAPTTLLAQADASIGGKVGVDLDGAKNMIGAFYPADLIVTDPDVLAALPFESLSDGLAEIVKSGMMLSTELLDWLESIPDAAGVLSRPDVIRRTAVEKARLTNADPFERSAPSFPQSRALLNFGHTVGHAIEAAGHYRLSHGQAVAIGMAAETKLAVRKGLSPPAVFDRLQGLLKRFGLPMTASDIDAERAMGFMLQDKKRQSGSLRFSVPTELGRGELMEVSEEDARQALNFALAVETDRQTAAAASEGARA
jgi:3-dehydroquinate synthase